MAVFWFRVAPTLIRDADFVLALVVSNPVMKTMVSRVTDDGFDDASDFPFEVIDSMVGTVTDGLTEFVEVGVRFSVPQRADAMLPIGDV
ncbi:MAG: hypothetical protein ACR2NZ_11960 [Rubripirellula sp.]